MQFNVYIFNESELTLLVIKDFKNIALNDFKISIMKITFNL